MKITPIVMDDFLLILLTIPLTNQSLEMEIYKIYNLPTLHPKLKIEFTYQMEGEYLVISKSRLYAAIPTAREIRICEATEGYLCLMNQALYPIEKLEWCTYALFAQDQNRIRQYCAINIQKRDANRAQSLDGYLWVMSSLKKEKMQVRCLLDTHVVDIKPPLTIIYVVHQQDRLLLSQLCLTFPSSMDGVGTKTARSSLVCRSLIIKLHPQNQTGPNLVRKASANQRPSRH